MASYTFRLNDKLKEEAFRVFESYGISPSQAMKLFLTQVAETKTVPLSLDYEPNKETIEAMHDLRNGNYETVESLDALVNRVTP